MTKEAFIFTKKNPKNLYRHIAFWICYYIFSLLTYFHPLLEKTTFSKWVVVEIVEVLCHVILQILFCYTIIYLLLPKFYNRKKYVAFIAGVVLLSLIIYVLYMIAGETIFRRMHTYAHLKFLSDDLLRWYLLVSFISYFPISTGLAIAFKTLKNFYRKQQDNQVLSRETANAELQLLKAQVHPHFLFNTLNNIYSFTLTKSMQAPQLIMNLSDTLHYMVTDCEENIVSLTQELKMLNNYIALEKVRYGNLLDLEIEITGESKGKKIVPLLMIPFIENSFKHGASKMLRNPWIKLFIQADENILHFTLINSKPADIVNEKKGGIGLSNVKKRLLLLYPQNYLLTIESTANTFTVNMQIPLQKIDEEVLN